jgi:regulator of replication initiation timing
MSAEQTPWERAADDVYRRACTREERVQFIRAACEEHAAAFLDQIHREHESHKKTLEECNTLKMENERLREASELWKGWKELRAENERLFKAISTEAAACAKVMNERDALAARVEQLESAIKGVKQYGCLDDALQRAIDAALAVPP